MKRFRIVLILFFVFLIPVILLYCGGNPAEEGKAAFDRGDYMQAINLFTQAKNENPDQPQYDEMIALSWMFRGEQLYSRTKNINTFSGNFEKGLMFIPETVSPEFKTKYSEMLYKIADAYMNSDPANEIQAEEFQSKAVDYLKTACVEDENNQAAWDLLDKIKKENFQSMFDKGKTYFSQAKSTKNSALYLIAELYLAKATDYDPDNQEAAKLLQDTRKKTINMINTDPSYGEIALAIADSKFLEGIFIVDVDVANNLRQPAKLIIENFVLADKDGNIYNTDQSVLTEFKDKQIKDAEIPALKTISGWVGFKVNKGISPDYLSYQIADDKIVKKYFP